MRGIISLVSVFALLMAFPVSVRAGDAERSNSPADEPSVQSESPPSESSPTARGVRRWHPDAFKTPEGETLSDVQIDYVPAAPPPNEERRRRNRRVAIGVSVALVVVVGAAIGTGVALSSLNSWE